MRSLADLALVAAMTLAAPAFAQGTMRRPMVRRMPAAHRDAVTAPASRQPDRDSVNEEQLFKQSSARSTGRITIPDAKAATLEQPQGRECRGFREGWMPWIGGLAILGMLAAARAVLSDPRARSASSTATGSGRKILRFNAFERFTHWMTATLLHRARAVRPQLHLRQAPVDAARSARTPSPTFSQWAKYAHNFLAWPFMVGILLMLAVWIARQHPEPDRLAWMKAGGGFVGHRHPPARRFNAGQKVVFWIGRSRRPRDVGSPAS